MAAAACLGSALLNAKIREDWRPLLAHAIWGVPPGHPPPLYVAETQFQLSCDTLSPSFLPLGPLHPRLVSYDIFMLAPDVGSF